jgi:hypothetical protein
MRFVRLAVTGAFFCLPAGSAHALEGEALGPFVRVEASRISLLLPRCVRKGDRLDCQFATSQIAKASEKGQCTVIMNSYPVSFKLAADGSWRATEAEPNCPTGRTDRKIELIGEGTKKTGARLTISGCHAGEASVLEYQTKDPAWAADCGSLAMPGRAATIDFIQKPK